MNDRNGGLPTPDTVCVVGAGPGGLALARAFKRLGIAAEVYERHDGVGGIWDCDSPGSPMYDSAHFISSKTQSHYLDFPMPDDYPDYPSNRQILAYMRSFAEAYDLLPMIRLRTPVERAYFEHGGWTMRLGDGRTRRFRWLVCANGTNWHPNIPQFPGHFSGELRHALHYRSTDELRGRRVLVVGAGNSGCDIACDAAQAASAAFISLRRGYHFIPKLIFGKPADVFAHDGPKLPMWLTQRVFGLMLRVLQGDLRRHGLAAPDHRIFESHPIVNDQLLHYLAHGDIKAKPDIARLDGDAVVFADGSRETVDLIILATGYGWQIPYVDETAFDWKRGRPDLYLNLFSRGNAQLFAFGFMETNGGAYKLFDHMADLVARAIRADRDDPVLAARLRALVEHERPDLSGGVRYVDSDRHATYVNIDAYQKAVANLRRRMGWPDIAPGDFAALSTTLATAASPA
jgi:hypothetical protein